MTPRRLDIATILIVACSLTVGLDEASANGFGVSERVFMAPTASYVEVPSSYLASTSYLVAPETTTFGPAYSVVRPTGAYYSTRSYRPLSRGLLGTLFPTRYYVENSYVTPTRYVIDDLATTSYLSTSYAYPSQVLYGSGLLPTTSVICRDGPLVGTVPDDIVRSPSTEPRLSVPESGRAIIPPETGRGAALESRPNARQNSAPIKPLDTAPEADAAGDPQPTTQGDRILDPEIQSPPIPEGPDGEDANPFPIDPFDSRDSMRPPFSGGLSASAAIAAAKVIEGRVRGETGGAPIAGLTVRFSNVVSTSFADRRAITDDLGNFRLTEFLPDGDWSIVISGDSAETPTRTYPQITVVGGRIYDRSGRDYSKLVLNY